MTTKAKKTVKSTKKPAPDKKPLKKKVKKVTTTPEKKPKKAPKEAKQASETKKPKKAEKPAEPPKGFKRGPKKEGEEDNTERPMTDKQREVLNQIAEYTRAGLPPTLRELSDHFGHTSSKGCAQSIGALEKRGLVTKTGNKSRGIQITPLGCAELEISMSESPLLCVYTNEELIREIKYRGFAVEKREATRKPKGAK